MTATVPLRSPSPAHQGRSRFVARSRAQRRALRFRNLRPANRVAGQKTASRIFFAAPPKTRPANPSQTLGLHQQNLVCGYDFASGCAVAPNSGEGHGSEGGALDTAAQVVGAAATGAGAVENVQNGAMGFWVGKNGKAYSTSWGGNGATGGRLKFAGEIAEGAHAAGTVIGVVGLGVSAVQGYNAFKDHNTNGMVQAGADFGMGVVGTWGGPIGWAASGGYFAGQMIDHWTGASDKFAKWWTGYP